MSGPELTATLVAAAAAYGFGATPFGYMAGKIHGRDIRKEGSGNIGATNVIRVLGKKVGIPVFILDMLKGWLPVILAGWWGGKNGISPHWPTVAAAVGAVLGHNFTFWLGFRGGKGVATSAGALLGLLPIPLAAALAVWVVLFYSTRFVAVASIGAAVAVPVVTVCQQVWAQPPPGAALVGFSILLGALAIWRHRSNIQRLMNGTENRFVPKKDRVAGAACAPAASGSERSPDVPES